MSKKHFEVIVATIRALPIDNATRAIVARAFAVRLSEDNARFNDRMFFVACGVSIAANI